jgi:hypothetical protein
MGTKYSWVYIVYPSNHGKLKFQQLENFNTRNKISGCNSNRVNGKILSMWDFTSMPITPSWYQFRHMDNLTIYN